MFPDVNGMISCDVIHGLTFLLAADSMLMDLKMALGESHQQDVHADGYKSHWFGLSVQVLCCVWSSAWACGLEPYLGERKMILSSLKLGVLFAFAPWGGTRTPSRGEEKITETQNSSGWRDLKSHPVPYLLLSQLAPSPF